MIDISIIMPVYNEDKYLHAAIDSILSQTFDNFEFIIIDDASTDNSLQIIKSYTDKRIILICNEYNVGNYPSRNRGFSRRSPRKRNKNGRSVRFQKRRDRAFRAEYQ